MKCFLTAISLVTVFGIMPIVAGDADEQTKEEALEVAHDMDELAVEYAEAHAYFTLVARAARTTALEQKDVDEVNIVEEAGKGIAFYDKCAQGALMASQLLAVQNRDPEMALAITKRRIRDANSKWINEMKKDGLNLLDFMKRHNERAVNLVSHPPKAVREILDRDEKKEEEELAEKAAKLKAANIDPKAVEKLSVNYLKAAPTEIAALKDAAQNGDIESQYLLGIAYHEGAGVMKDPIIAASWFLKAAQQGEVKSQVKIGMRLLCGGGGVPKDPKEGVNWLAKAAAQGNSMAQFLLATCHHEGLGLAVDTNTAISWYAKSSDNGYAPAQYVMGNMYIFGEGLPKDPPKGISLITKSAEQGYLDSQMQLAFHFRTVDKDIKKHMHWLTKAGESGSVEAQKMLGSGYLLGEEGWPKDLNKGLDWMVKAAEQGDEESQYFAAMRYFEDESEDNDKKAFEWFTKAANQGSIIAHTRLGLCYARGIGVNKDLGRALAMFSIAAKKEDADAQFYMGLFHAHGKAVPKDPKKAVNWYEKAANQGHIDSQYMMGNMHERGSGIKQDRDQAAKWYRKAAESGHAEAQFKLGAMYYYGMGVEEDRKKAKKWVGKSHEAGFKKAGDVWEDLELWKY